MKNKDLIALLQNSDPEGDVIFSLDTAIVDGSAHTEDMQYSYYNFEVVAKCSSKSKTTADRIYLGLSDAEVDRILGERRKLIPTAPKYSLPDNTTSIGAPVAVAVSMSEQTYKDLIVVVESCNRSHDAGDGATTHGELTVSTLLGMLAEDAAMTNSRPGSWEGSNMQQVLDGHGYQ